MPDTFICTENPEHRFSQYSGQDGAADVGKSWYECDEHPGRVRAGYYDAPACVGHLCGHPSSDHPTTAQRYTASKVGTYTAVTVIDKNGIRTDTNEVVYNFPVWSHSHHGDGPCPEPVGMHKRTGFLCIECGAPLDGMPTKE